MKTLTLEQAFATQIYGQVLEYKERADKKQYGSMAYTLPILIRTAGLAQALAFVESRKKDSYNQLLDHLAEVVMEKDEEKNKASFLNESRKAGLQEYMYMTRRTLLALKWYKRFAESVLDVKSTDANINEAGGPP